MSLKDEIKDYTQPDLLISPDRNPGPDSTGNGPLYLSLYHFQLVKQGLSRPEDKASFEAIITTCFKRPGLLMRSPTKIGEQEGPDDYIGVCAASKALKSDLAHIIVDYGNGSRYLCFKWIYNNLEPGKFTGQSWFGRQPHVIGHMQWAAGIIPEVPRQWALLLHFATQSMEDNAGCILSYLMAETCYGLSRAIDLAIDDWRGHVQTCYPQGMKDIVGAHLGKDHPIAKYWV